ncbi:MAG: hypothetical protein R3343_14725 [Nitriliruptorales bacterium]|nr:hypothetical protein [Nitriliruptorales bacterium]
MAAPFIYVSTYEVAEGRLDDARRSLAEHAEFVEANEPRLIAFHFYLDPDSSTVSIVQVHPDSASMDFHMQLIAEHISSAMGDYLGAPVSALVCGEGKETVETIRSFSPDDPVRVAEEHIAGFTRTTAG